MKIEKLSQGWILAMENSNKSSEANDWSIDYVINLPFEEKFNELWDFIKHTYNKDINEKVTGCLAAGALEDLLANAGETYIKEIEDLSRKDPKFRHLLGGVWQNSMSKEIWQRVCAARGASW